jgi:hypothetical protein
MYRLSGGNWAMCISATGSRGAVYTVTPTISHDVDIYEATVGSAATVTVTVAAEEPSNVDVYINSVLTTSTSVSTPIVGVNNIPIAIKSKIDNTTKNYTLKLNRTS